MTRNQKAYFAALFDDTASLRDRGGKGIELTLRTREVPARLLQAQYGGSCRRVSGSRWRWSLTNRQMIHDFIFDVEPFLVVKGKEARRAYASLHSLLRASP